ncbi:hypothetical protein C8P68_102217 [Mucilaginibacter yixingensis]|uniref:Uncharacterized protein n=1 Tax=Mucilaginibacter yixingensis TaxID=1295612 RepID=A0A2T5JCB5_9SPHI|nr:hypothetical protein [Mucilaginibacter yixingensis]PTQ99396.1 hypothetical protein C8P68_102217 [Mucilaginibacter yixingensis]
MKTGNLFWRKVLVYSLRALASLFLLASFLVFLMTFITDVPVVYDKHAAETALVLFVALSAFIVSLVIKADPVAKENKTNDILLNQIRKSNLNKTKEKKS